MMLNDFFFFVYYIRCLLCEKVCFLIEHHHQCKQCLISRFIHNIAHTNAENVLYLLWADGYVTDTFALKMIHANWITETFKQQFSHTSVYTNTKTNRNETFNWNEQKIQWIYSAIRMAINHFIMNTFYFIFISRFINLFSFMYWRIFEN